MIPDECTGSYLCHEDITNSQSTAGRVFSTASVDDNMLAVDRNSAATSVSGFCRHDKEPRRRMDRARLLGANTHPDGATGFQGGVHYPVPFKCHPVVGMAYPSLPHPRPIGAFGCDRKICAAGYADRGRCPFGPTRHFDEGVLGCMHFPSMRTWFKMPTDAPKPDPYDAVVGIVI